MANPVQFIIKPDGHNWVLRRDDETVATYGHLDRVTHEAVKLARELHETGEPAQVFVHVSAGKVIEVDTDPEVTQREERRGPAARED